MAAKRGDYKMIAVSPKTYTDLRKYGVFGDTFNDIVVKILNQVENQKGDLVK